MSGRPKSVRRLVAEGEYLEALEAMAVRLAAEIDNPEAPASSKAAIARELRPALALLNEHKPGSSKGDKLDELAKRRDGRASA